jgi:hypothetical protein
MGRVCKVRFGFGGRGRSDGRVDGKPLCLARRQEHVLLNGDASWFTDTGPCSGFDNQGTDLASPFPSQASARRLW